MKLTGSLEIDESQRVILYSGDWALLQGEKRVREICLSRDSKIRSKQYRYWITDDNYFEIKGVEHPPANVLQVYGTEAYVKFPFAVLHGDLVRVFIGSFRAPELQFNKLFIEVVYTGVALDPWKYELSGWDSSILATPNVCVALKLKCTAPLELAVQVGVMRKAILYLHDDCLQSYIAASGTGSSGDGGGGDGEPGRRSTRDTKKPITYVPASAAASGGKNRGGSGGKKKQKSGGDGNPGSVGDSGGKRKFENAFGQQLQKLFSQQTRVELGFTEKAVTNEKEYVAILKDQIAEEDKLLVEKDKLIAEKDRIIAAKDDEIRTLHTHFHESAAQNHASSLHKNFTDKIFELSQDVIQLAAKNMKQRN